MAGIYIHIPFCKRRCIYCDFYSTTHNEMQEAYIQAVCQELDMRKDYLKGEIIETIYLGGGTPSQLGHDSLHLLLNHIYKEYPVSSEAEITIEANPDDLHEDYIRMLRSLPFNRISMGIQTFHEPLLQKLQRRHTAKQAVEAFTNCRRAGFNNISIDLMYGLPGETTEIWERDLNQAIHLRPEHISAYHLIYEEGTPLWKLREQKAVQEVDESTSVLFFRMLMERLQEAGYEHYEISNFALPQKESRHNSSYWKGKNYLGCGAAAHSYNGLSRQWNISSLEQYIKGIQSNAPCFEKEELDLYTRYNDYIITRLRTHWGISLTELNDIFGEALRAYCIKLAKPHLQQGTLVQEDDTIRLTREGIFISDGIMSDLLWV